MSERSGEPATEPEFLDEFYAECEEHLTGVRRSLGRLGEATGKPVVGNEAWERLLREMHSLKGILGMAGLGEPERLAHATEDYLRTLSRGATALEEEPLDALAVVTETLEHVLAAHRQRQSIPEVTPILENIVRLGQSPPAGVSEPGSVQETVPTTDARLQARLHRAHQQGRRVWRALFVPSSELSQRGINVNEVRKRLQALGELVHSVPRIQPGAGIVFEFLVVTEREPEEQARWKEVGVTLEPYRASAIEAGQKGTPGLEGAAETRMPDLSAPAYVAPSHFVRVDLSRLDDLMQAMGEMVVYRARLEETLARLVSSMPAGEARALQEINSGFTRELRRLREGLLRVRLVPLAEIFERMSLVVRDMVRESGRKIRLEVHGQGTLVDKYIVERLKDPLLHLVRNAVVHGLDSAAERAARGKPEALTIWLRASTVGESVLLEVQDDGQGLNEQKVRAQAEQRGLVVPEPLTPAGLLDLLCLPGFSTKDQADLGGGRGVGMAVVKNTVTELGGELGLHTEVGQGTTFTLRLPLTLAIADALLIEVGSQKFALPQSGLQEVTTISPKGIHRLERSEFIRYRQGVLPLVRLAQMFHLPSAQKPEYPVLVVGHGADRLGLLAERILGQREIMVRTLNDPLLKTPAVSGATELGDGRAVLILDPLGLIQTAHLQSAPAGNAHKVTQ